MFKNLTMDASSIARSLPDNVSWLSQEAKRWRRGNVQKLNYGFPGKALSPSCVRYSLESVSSGAGWNTEVLSTFNYGSGGKASLASHAHRAVLPGDEKRGPRKRSKT